MVAFTFGTVELQASANGRTANLAALASGGFVAVWQGSGTGDANGVFGQRYQADGSPIGTAFLVNTTTTGVQGLLGPVVSGLAGGGFVAVWTDDSSGTAVALRSQVYNSSGAKVGTETTLNTSVGSGVAPAVVGLPGGGFVVTWDDTNDRAYAQLYSAAGASVGSARALSVSAGNEQATAVAVINNGFIAAAWQDNKNGDISVRLFDGALVPHTGEIDVGASVGNKTAPSISALPNGGFVLAWEEVNGASHSARVQMYSATGTKVGSEIIPGNNTSSNSPTVAGLYNGGFLVTWNQNTAAGEEGTYGRSYSATGVADSTAVKINTTAVGTNDIDTVRLLSGRLVAIWDGATGVAGGFGSLQARVLDPGVAITAGDNNPLITDPADVSSIQIKGTIVADGETHFRINYGGGNFDDYYGTSFKYTAGKPTSGTITHFADTVNGVTTLDVAGVSFSVANLISWVDNKNSDAWLTAVYGGDNSFVGSNQTDVIHAHAGADILFGRGGDDVLDGDIGIDTAVYTGRFQDYRLTNDPTNGSLSIADLRTGAPDGKDLLIEIEQLQFSDRMVSLAPPPANSQLTIAFANMLRQDTFGGNAATINDMLAQISAGMLTMTAALNRLEVLARASTSVVTLAYEFFTGKTPSAGGYDYLVSPNGPNPNNLNSAYYQSFNLENRYINFAVNLGKAGEGRASFETAYGSKTLFDATKTAYATIFGGAPSDDKVHALIDSRVSYFASYGGDGAQGIGTKAAMVGWLLAEAIKADVGMYAKSNDAFLNDLSANTGYQVDLIGVYGNPSYVVGGG